MIIILKKIFAILAALALLPIQVLAYDVVNLPNSMSFADAAGIYDASEIVSASISDLGENKYMELGKKDYEQFYNTASDVTVWRKINPTPFRGACVTFKTKSGISMSYFFGSGLQIGTYGTDNYVCYMPAAADAARLSYLESEFRDAKEGVYGGTRFNVNISKDFLKLPSQDWAKAEISAAAAKCLVPYELTAKYGQNISRAELTELIANFLVVTGNYSGMDSYLEDKGRSWSRRNFIDCDGRGDIIDQLFALGIITGKTDVKFDPDGQVTRQELATFITRCAEQYMYINTSYKVSSKDRPAIASWARFYVSWNVDKGIMSLDDSKKFYPYDPVTIEQAVTAINRLYNVVTN